MGLLEVSGLTKTYGATTAITDVGFSVDDGEFFVILGPSGAGKTTTLKSIAGLVDLDAGNVRIGGRDVTDVEPYHRNVAMAFESYALYPQKTVAQNLASPLRSGRTGTYQADEQATRIEAVTTTLGIAHLRERFPRELSNGQRQRTALGRVLVRPADVHLLDEPLSHLDAKLRAAMRAELRELAQTSSTTTLYVTHDYQEALALGDRIAVLRHGQVVQIGPPEAIWRTPVDTFVAKTLGQPEINLLDAQVDDGHIRASGGIDLPVPERMDVATGARVRLGFRPRDLEVVRGDTGVDGALVISGTVRLSERLGRSMELAVRVGDAELIAVDVVGHGVTEGSSVDLRIAPADVHVFAGAEGHEETARLGSLGHRDESDAAPRLATTPQEGS